MAVKKRKNSRQKRPADGVSITISPVTLVMAVFFVAFGMAYEFVCSFTAVIVHELAHAKVAKRFGYALTEIRLMPYGAALCGSADMTPRHEAAIAIAGPAVNLALGLIFAALWWLIPVSYAFTHTFCLCNIYIGAFNLLPVFPLDGGRIALALFSVKLRRERAYKAIRVLSAVTGCAAIALFVLSAVYAFNPCFLFVGLFLTVSAFIPDRRAQYYSLFSFSARKLRLLKPLEQKLFAAPASARLYELVRALDPDRFTSFDIYDGEKKIAHITERELSELIKTHGYEREIGSITV